MAVYIVIGVIVALLLLLAYRVLGGSSTGSVDSAALLRNASLTVSEISAAALHDDPRTLRRRLDLAAQQLEQVEAGELSHAEGDAHALLATAVHELQWAMRLRESAQQKATGMVDAVDALLNHARRCAADADRLLTGSGGAEEVHGPAQPLIK